MLNNLFKSKPLISIIVIAYNMERELPRTLYSLTREYQQNIDGLNYEVIVVDNGSEIPINTVVDIKSFGSHFRYHYIKNASASPAEALNLGANLAKGKILCFMIDGARILSPGILHSAWVVFSSSAYKDPTVSVTGFHLGPDLQNKSSEKGYKQSVEDKLLKEIDWKANGYRLFEVSVFAGSCGDGWFGAAAESNAIFLSRESYNKMGKFDEQFDMPGGGFINLDFYYRAVMRENTEHIVLLGEGTFHQIHGGVATNCKKEEQEQKIKQWHAQYVNLRGVDFKMPSKQAYYLGMVDKSANSALKKSANSVV